MSGETLSASEEAARSQREATAAELVRYQDGCALAPEFLGQKQIADGIVANMVTLPDLAFLTFMQMVYEGPEMGTFAIRAFNEVPNGGIAGFDFCRQVSLDTFQEVTRAGQIVRINALHLRQGLDVAADYPNTSVYLAENDLLIDVPAGTYAMIDTSAPEISAWYQEMGAQWAAQNADGPGIGFGQVLALRVGD